MAGIRLLHMERPTASWPRVSAAVGSDSAAVLQTKRPSYAEIGLWRKYQPYFPAAIQITEGREPAEEWWSWRDGSIHLDRYEAPDAPCQVILLHGAGGCGRLLAPFGLMLQSHGYETVLPDLPGYGLSRVPNKLFHYEHWVSCVVDLVHAEFERSPKPVVLFGLSVGGYLAYLAAAKGRNVAGVMATTLADPRLPIVRDQFARFPRLNRSLTPLLPPLTALFGKMRLPVRWFANMQGVANDPALSDLLCADPVGGGNRVPLRFLQSIVSIEPEIEPEDFDLCPALLAHPAEDLWTTIEASRPFFDRIQGPKELVMLENCGHLPVEEPGVNQLEDAMVAFLRNVA